MSQSKKLAEILPLESADMCFNTHNNMPPLMAPYSRFKEFFNMEPIPAFLIPCWSFAALLGVLPDRTCVYKKTYKDGRIKYQGIAGGIKELILKDNPIDACVAMIERLHELNLL